MNIIQNEIPEKCYLIKNDISIKNEITPKVAADFSIAFYKLFKKNYDEKLFINIIKKVMEFFNYAMLDFPNNNDSKELEKIINDIELLKESIEKICVLKNKNLNSPKEISPIETSELYKKEFKELKKEINSLLLNKPLFLYRWQWKKQLKKKLIKLSILQINSKNKYDQILKNNSKKNIILEEMFLEIKNHLKTFMFEVNPTIGEELADIPYECVMEGKEELKGFIFDVVINNLYQYSTLKKHI